MGVEDVSKLAGFILEDMMKCIEPVQLPAAGGGASLGYPINDMFRCMCYALELPAVEQMEVSELWRLLVQLPAVIAPDLRWWEGCMWGVAGQQPHNDIPLPSSSAAWLQMRQGENMLHYSLVRLLELPVMQQQHLPEQQLEFRMQQQQQQGPQQQQLQHGQQLELAMHEQQPPQLRQQKQPLEQQLGQPWQGLLQQQEETLQCNQQLEVAAPLPLQQQAAQQVSKGLTMK